MATAGTTTTDLKVRKLHHIQWNVRVHVTREFRFRLWLAVRLIRLAGWVLGTNVTFVNALTDPEPPER